MASSFSISTFVVFLLPFFIFISLSIARPTTKATSDLINEICSKTQNPPLCQQTLTSDPRSVTADLKGLGLISLDVAQTNAKKTSNLIASLLKQATDPKLKGRYSTCAENYGNTINDLNVARRALNKQNVTALDIGTFRIYASAALDGPDTCEDSFEGLPVAPVELQQANCELEALCSTVLVIGAHLKAQ